MLLLLKIKNPNYKCVDTSPIQGFTDIEEVESLSHCFQERVKALFNKLALNKIFAISNKNKN
jgi:hypothetical protein